MSDSNTVELWELLDENGSPTGEVIHRGQEIPRGKYHLIVQIWLISSEGNLLIQQRNKPGSRTHRLWAPTAGSVLAGETSLEAAVRECDEEIGLQLNPVDLRFHHRDRIADFFQDIWLGRWHGDLSRLRLQTEEVMDAKITSFEKILHMVENAEFIPYGDVFFESLRTGIAEMGSGQSAERRL